MNHKWPITSYPKAMRLLRKKLRKKERNMFEKRRWLVKE